MSCNRFKNLDFQGFCQGSQTKIEKLAFMSHLRKCLECGLKFLIYIDSLLDNSGDSDSMAEIATAQPRSIEFLNELVKVTGRADRDKISIEDAREALFMEGELPVPISEPPGYYCDRWEEAAFERYANQKATTEDIAEVHGHAEKCEACNVRFIIPLQEEYEQGTLDVTKEFSEAFEISWNRREKDSRVFLRASERNISVDQAKAELIAEGVVFPNDTEPMKKECQRWQHIEVDKFFKNQYHKEIISAMHEHMVVCSYCMDKFMKPLYQQIKDFSKAERKSEGLENSETKCNQYKEVNFQGFCKGSQARIDKLAFMSHLKKCLECSIKFLAHIDNLLDSDGERDPMAEIMAAQPRSIEFINEIMIVNERVNRDKISIADAREMLFVEGELPVSISEPPGYYCDRWEEAAFERYANQKATTEDIAEVHGHAEKCEACNVRFLFPLQDEYEQSSLESSREDDEMYEAAWQRFMKLPMPVRATAQQAPIEQATEKAAAKLIPLPNKKGSVRRECQEWQHIEVDKFRQNYYSWETMAQMSEHMLNCTDCLNKFMSPLHPQIDAEKRSDDRKDEELILRGPHAQQVAEDYSKIYFRASKKKITNLEAAQELIAEGEIAAIPRALIPGNSFPEVIGRIIESNENALVNKSVATAASKDIDKSQGASNKESETTNKVVSINRNAPAKKNGRNYIKYLQVAALVLVALLPIVVVYKLFYSPLSNRQDGMAISKIITDTAKLDVNQAAENYEAMNEENRLNKDVKTVLAGNAANLEKLLLLEDALEQYKQLLPLAKQDGEKQLVEKKIADLEKQLNPGAQKPTRYESLQEALDQYLEAVKNSDTATAGVAMDKAEAIAKEMEDKTGEKFGADTILFYKSKVTSREVAARLIAGHTVLKEIQQNRGSLDFRKQYQRAAEAAKSFAEVKANCDLELANIQVSIFLSLLDKDSFDQAQKLLKENVVNTKLSKHLFNQAQFLALLGKNLGKSSQYAEAIEAYTASVELSKNLDVPKFYLYPIQGLAYIYMSLNDDQQTFNLAYGAFQSAIQSKDNLRLMDLSQALGVSAFNLHYSKVAEKYFNYQAKIAQQSNHSQGLARSKAILGIIKAELGEFSKAEKNLADAQQIVDQISDASAHNFIQFYVTGYYARVKMISGNADEAINLYQKTLELGLAANIKESLPLSQLHQGLAECYMAKGQPQLAKTQLQVAENYASEARTHLEVQNALLTFAATHKSIADQLKTIENN